MYWLIHNYIHHELAEKLLSWHLITITLSQLIIEWFWYSCTPLFAPLFYTCNTTNIWFYWSFIPSARSIHQDCMIRLLLGVELIQVCLKIPPPKKNYDTSVKKLVNHFFWSHCVSVILSFCSNHKQNKFSACPFTYCSTCFM